MLCQYFGFVVFTHFFTRSYFFVRQLFRSLNIQLTHARYLNISFHEREIVEPVKKTAVDLDNWT